MPSDLGHRFERVELNLLYPALDGNGMKLLARKVEAGRLRRAAREHQRAIVFLGQALEPRRGVHRVADGRDELRTRRPHRADDRLGEMNADPDPQGLLELAREAAIELIEARQHFARA